MMLATGLRGAARKLLPLGMLSRLRAASTIVLRYHSIAGPDPLQSAVIPAAIRHDVDLFDRQMAMLAKHFHTCDIDTVSRITRDSRPQRRSVAITFDDGFKDNILLAAPVLAKHGIKAAFYVITGNLESRLVPWFCRTFYYFQETKKTEWRNPLTGDLDSLETSEERRDARRSLNGRLARFSFEEQERLLEVVKNALDLADPSGEDILMGEDDIRELLRQGHLIGSHSLSHPNLTLLSQDQLDLELTNSKEYLEGLFGDNIRHFSYPNPFFSPHWNDQVSNRLKGCGYSTAVTSTNGCVTGTTNPFAIPRFSVPQTVADLKWLLDKSFAGI